MTTPELPVVLSYGMGYDSTAILRRWLTDQSSRDFPLDRLIVVTAQVGSEWPDTVANVGRFIVPLLRTHGVRFVQLARGGPKQADGIVLLDDSRHPTQLHADGAWQLATELQIAGTVPQVASGQRRCSQKFKGWVIDTWIAGHLPGPYRHVIGYNRDEPSRIARDHGYTTKARAPEYPLYDWGWGRSAVESYVDNTFGVTWGKSYCWFCPFPGNRANLSAHLERIRQFPELGAEALRLEHVSTALNPRLRLFGKTTLRENVEAARLGDALTAYYRLLESTDWALYEVRRVYRAARSSPALKGQGWRSVRQFATGDRAAMEAELRMVARDETIPVTVDVSVYRHSRLWLERRGTSYPTRERMVTIAPATVLDKERGSFADAWDATPPATEAAQIERSYLAR